MVKALRFALVFLVLVGTLYPLSVLGLAQALFPRQADGSLISGAAGVSRGSELIGQAFTRPEFFHGRISAVNYDAAAASGSNYGPTDAALIDRVRADTWRWASENPGVLPPPDLLTASGSGIDPHISPQAALAQVPRISRATGVAPADLLNLIENQIEEKYLGIFGECRANVLKLNLALLDLLGH
jgi:K+-transporting ATPase ATPase C chain